jgi:DeoR/GlpR family transcriptional regulator of sugar metabolism
VDEQHAAVLAFLADGEAWSSSALAIALGASSRTVQRALDQLAGSRQGAVVRPGAGAPVDGALRAGVPDDLVTPKSAPERLG